jgi:hypothetical protein
VIRPAPYWTWSLVSRTDEDRAAVHAVIKALTKGVGSLDLDGGDSDDGEGEAVWLPVTDPHNCA